MYLIMSNGHSATRWIANRLRKDNLSHCYHSYDLINTNPSLKDIVTYHHFLKDNINKNRIIGSIHLPYHLNELEKSKLNEMDVKIFYLVRNPFDKINSMINFYLEKFILNGFFSNSDKIVKKNINFNNLDAKEAYKNCDEYINNFFNLYFNSKKKYYVYYLKETLQFRIYKKFKNLKINNSIFENKNCQKYLSLVMINLFLYASRSCLIFDKQCIYEKNIIKFEKIVENEKNFIDYALLLDNRLNIDNLNMSNFKDKIGRNVKDYSKKDFWPKSFKEFFNEQIENENLKRFYLKMNYQFN